MSLAAFVRGMVGWGQLKDAVKPLQVLIFFKLETHLFPDLFPGFVRYTPLSVLFPPPHQTDGHACRACAQGWGILFEYIQSGN